MDRFGVDDRGLGKFVARVSARFPLRLALLFGSRARGDELRESDDDLLLVSPAFEGLPWGERAASVLEEWHLDECLEALCCAPEEFEWKKGAIGIVAEVVRTGRPLPLDAKPSPQ